MKTIIVNPQWQGGADPVTYTGAMELKELYLGTCECALASVAPWAEMPLRSLMDGDCFGLMDNAFPLTSAQVVHVGARDLDDAEETCIERSDISRITVEDVRTDAYTVVQAVEAIGCSNVYVHLDLDVLNPTEFPNTPLPVAGGLTAEELLTVLESLTPKTAGMGIFEYAPAGKRISLIERILKMGLALYPPPITNAAYVHPATREQETTSCNRAEAYLVTVKWERFPLDCKFAFKTKQDTCL